MRFISAVAFSFVSLLACSSDIQFTPPSEALTDASADTNVTEHDSGTTPSSDGGPTTMPRVGVRYLYSYAADGPFKTTATACAGSAYWGDRCGTCESGVASPGVAAVYVGSTPTQIAQCDALPKSTEGAVKMVAYCCETPFIMTGGSTTSPEPCDVVCAAKGLICTTKAPMYDGFGGSPQPGTAYVDYSPNGTASNSTGYAYASCTDAPATTKIYKGQTLSLRTHSCACVDPLSVLPTPP